MQHADESFERLPELSVNINIVQHTYHTRNEILKGRPGNSHVKTSRKVTFALNHKTQIH
jgi:hypothetical protein